MMRQQEEEQPPSRRLVGIDLGIASRHSVRVLEADGRQVCRSSCVPTVASLSAVEQAALAGAPEGTRLAVVFEPTGSGVAADRGVLRPPRATRSTGFRRPRPLIYAGSCAGTRNRTGSTRRRWPGCRWPTRAGCSRSSWRACRRRRWTGGSGRVTG